MDNPFITQAQPTAVPTASPTFAAEQREIERMRRMAELLDQQSAQPEGNMVSGIYVAPSITQRLAAALNPMLAEKRRGVASEREAALADRMNKTMQADLQAYQDNLSGRPAQSAPSMAPTVGNDPNNPMMVETAPAIAPDRNKAFAALLQSQHPALQQMGGRLMAEAPAIDARRAERQDERAWREQQAKAIAEERRQLAQQQIDLRRELADQASADRRFMAGMANSRKEQQNVPKLPTSALKMQQEELDAIGAVGTINADLGAMEKQIDAGKLQLGPVNNLAAQARNAMGLSDEPSRNFASFQATLEKLRNESLRLNKGVQTEGDAQRAWNELVANANDPKVVKQRLGEIQRLNNRAADLRRMNIDAIRTNFGVGPMDTAPRQNLPAAVGGGQGGGFKIIGVE